MRAVMAFLGGAGTVTGSRFLVTTEPAQVLLDCGLFQGVKALRKRNWSPFPVDPDTLDAIALTHAHLDHIGYLPALVRDGYDGPVFATAGTAALAGIILPDSGRLQEEDARHAARHGYSKHSPALPLYTERDAQRALELFRTIPTGQGVVLADGMTARFHHAGHILGASRAPTHEAGSRCSRPSRSTGRGGAREIHGEYVPVRAAVADVPGFSVHADQSEILAWLGSASRPPGVTHVVHGEPDAAEALHTAIRDALGWNVVVPRQGERVRLRRAHTGTIVPTNGGWTT